MVNSGKEEEAKNRVRNGESANATTASLQLVLDDGSKVTVTSATPLYVASSQGRAQLMQFLLDNGANPNLRTGEGFTPLMVACKRGNLELATLLLKSGADVNMASPKGASPLSSAVLFGDPDLVDLLLTKGASPNPPGDNPLLISMAAPSIAARAANKEYDTQLFTQSYTRVVKSLLTAGANPNKQSGFGGILHVAVGLAPIDVIQMLLDAGATVSGKTVADSPEIKFARESRRNDVVKLLTQAWIKQHSKIDSDRPT